MLARTDRSAHEDASVDVAARLQAARRLAGLSLEEAARQLDVSVSTLRRAEAGERRVPKPWIAYAKAHWIPPDGMRHPLDPDD
jgi:ribosome-binding protein aMBF1 (putative translation factor)